MKEKFLVEIIFKRMFVNTNEEGNSFYDTKIETRQELFEGTNRSAVLHDAKSFMEKILRHGMDFSSGSIIKSVITPAAILQVGIVDDKKYQQEVAAGLQEVKVEPVTEEPVEENIEVTNE